MQKVNIRSITYTVDLKKIKSHHYQELIKENIFRIKKSYKDKNIDLRTIRFNIVVIDIFPKDENIFLDEITILSQFSKDLEIRWFNISFNLMQMCQKDKQRVRYLAYYIVKNFKNAFVNFIVANSSSVDIVGVKESAKLIKDVATIATNGFDNFRVGVSLNPSKYTPFFPFSYSDKEHSFSIAMEVTQLFIKILEKKFPIDVMRETLYKVLGEELVKIDTIAKELESETISYNGLDSSLAPYPDEDVSVIDILSLLGLDSIGSSGTLFLTSMLTDMIKETLKRNSIKAVGFNGVMYSVLEDKVLSKANDKKVITVDKLLSYATVCGCGLDMVPLPGDILLEEIESIILDTASISIKHRKPLGVRILPIPNKSTNEYTEFDMDFLTNTRILDIKNLYLTNELFLDTFTYNL